MMTKTQSTISVEVKQEIPIQRIADLLCGAFEGGSNYWYQIDEFIKPENFDNSEDPNHIYKHIDYPINKGGSLVISTGGDHLNELGKDLHVLCLSTIKDGLQVMAKDYPSQFNDFMQENDDASTSDVYLQCCLFGEVIFG